MTSSACVKAAYNLQSEKRVVGDVGLAPEVVAIGIGLNADLGVPDLGAIEAAET